MGYSRWIRTSTHMGGISGIEGENESRNSCSSKNPMEGTSEIEFHLQLEMNHLDTSSRGRGGGKNSSGIVEQSIVPDEFHPSFPHGSPTEGTSWSRVKTTAWIYDLAKPYGRHFRILTSLPPGNVPFRPAFLGECRIHLEQPKVTSGEEFHLWLRESNLHFCKDFYKNLWIPLHLILVF